HDGIPHQGLHSFPTRRSSDLATPRNVQAMLRACHQSQVIPDRSALERNYLAALQSSDAGVPSHWGGYRLEVATIEFWQARANWLDRKSTRLTPVTWPSRMPSA